MVFSREQDFRVWLDSYIRQRYPSMADFGRTQGIRKCYLSAYFCGKISGHKLERKILEILDLKKRISMTTLISVKEIET